MEFLDNPTVFNLVVNIGCSFAIGIIYVGIQSLRKCCANKRLICRLETIPPISVTHPGAIPPIPPINVL